MTMDNVGQGSWTDAFHQYQADIIGKIKRGQTEEEIPIGGASYTQTQWNRVLKSVDKQLDDIKEEQAARAEKQKNRTEAMKVFEAATAGSGSPVEHLREKDKVPYGFLANDGIIEYNGVTFVCDERTNSICLGDVSDKENTLTIPLAGGGCLQVNRDNLEQLAAAIGMFSPEDVNRILNAIAQDNKARSMEMELEDEKSDVVNMAAGEAEKKDGETQD